MIYQIYARGSERGSDWEGETSCAAQIAACREHLARHFTGVRAPTFQHLTDTLSALGHVGEELSVQEPK